LRTLRLDHRLAPAGTAAGLAQWRAARERIRFGADFSSQAGGASSLNVFFACLIPGSIGGLCEQVSASTFWLIHAGIVACGGLALLAVGGPLRRLLAAGVEGADLSAARFRWLIFRARAARLRAFNASSSISSPSRVDRHRSNHHR
jgi:hypothetical protein